MNSLSSSISPAIHSSLDLSTAQWYTLHREPVTRTHFLRKANTHSSLLATEATRNKGKGILPYYHFSKDHSPTLSTERGHTPQWRMYTHHGTGAHTDLRPIQHFITVNRKHQVDIAKYERMIDEAHFRNGQYAQFIELFKNRYPSQYVDVVEEYERNRVQNI